MPIFTHDRIKLTTGVLAKAGVLWGGNALQSITIGRHTPKDPQQSIGHLGVVDYTSGVVTSDITLDTILVEGCNKAGIDLTHKGTSIYRYAGEDLVLGSESYVATSFGLALAAGAPATFSLGFLTATIASYLDIQDQPLVEIGEESSYAIVMGDDGSGVKLVATWAAAHTALVSTVPILNSSGILSSVTDSGVPSGVQSLNLNGSINRDQILDVRTAQPIQFITTYPVDISMDIEVYENPRASAATNYPGAVAYNPDTYRHSWDKLLDIALTATALGKHNAAGAAALATVDDMYFKAIGLQKVDESEAVSVGRYLAYTINYIVSDLLLPMPSLYVAP